MLGVGRATEKVLTSYESIQSESLQKAPPGLLKGRLGKVRLQIFPICEWRGIAHPWQNRTMSRRSNIGHGITTKEDLENAAEVWNVMLSPTQDIGHKLRVYNKDAGGIAIDIRNNQLEHRQWQCQFPARTHSTSYIAKAAFDLF